MDRINTGASVSALECSENAFLQMQGMGFCALSAGDFSLTDIQKTDLKIIQNHFHSLPLDPYDKNSGRYRQHSKYVFLPSLELLIPHSSSEKVSFYKQDVGFNDEVTKNARTFEAVPESILLNKLIYAPFNER